MAIYDEIKEFLLSIGFSIVQENDVTIFRIKRLIPGRTLIVNGHRINEPDKWNDFDIIPIGKGAELDKDNNPVAELQGYNIGDNDFWVDSLKDFKFWLEQVVGRTSNMMVEQ